MRLIKVTGGLGNQMFIYAFYLRMKKYYPKVRIDLSDMMHYKVQLVLLLRDKVSRSGGQNFV